MNGTSRIRNVFAAFLAGSILLTACASDTVTGEMSDATAETDTTSETAADLSYKNILPDRDFGGAEYIIASAVNTNMAQLAEYELTTESLNGEIINDAVYNRHLDIESTYNVKILENKQSTNKDDLLKSFAAGDITSQLVMDAWANMATLACGGALRDWNQMEYIDITKPWYLQAIDEGASVCDKVYIELNYIPFTGLLYTHCLFFDKQAVEENGLTSPYELVNSGKWTIDAFNGCVKNMNRDLNGDSAFDENDYYGYMTSLGGSMVMTYAFDNKTVTVSNDGIVSLDMNTERFSDSIDKVLELCGGGYVVKNSAEADIAKMFADKHSLFYSGFISDTLLYFRDTDVDYGMVIFPKYDEFQENYYTKVGGGSFVFGIPALCGDDEMVSIITEALSIESYNTIRPAVYDITLKQKGLRDEESYEAYELITKNIVLDFGQLYRMGKSDCINMMQTCVEKGQNNLASLCASLEPSYYDHYQGIIDELLSLDY